MTQRITSGPLTATLRECWIDATNRRLSGSSPDWTERPTIHAVAIETVQVEKSERRQGHFRRFLADVCAYPRFEMVVVECVQNPILADYLMRQGWEFDGMVMDFYWRKK